MNDLDRQFTSPVFSFEAMTSAIVNPYGKPVRINGMPEGEAGNNSKPITKADEVKGVIFVIVFILAIIGAVVLAQIEPVLCVADIGAVFLVIGLINLTQNKPSLENLPFVFVPIIGALMTFIPIMNVYSRTHPNAVSFSQQEVIKLILILAEIVGALLIIVPLVVRAKKSTKCTASTNAMCIYRNTHDAKSKNGLGRTRHYNLYAITWQYEINNIIYVTRDNSYTNEDVPHIGEMREIYYSPSDPSEIYRPLMTKKIVPLIIGIMFMVIATVALYVI